jgi:short-subunit dehydrogenase
MITTVSLASAYMVKEKSGHIIMTSSLAGLITVPQWSVYCASKWAITGFADGLRTELAKFNITVTSLHPGLVKNEFFEKGKADFDLSGYDTVTSDDVANAVYEAAFSQQRRIHIPKNVKTYGILYKLFQKPMEKMLVKAFKLD